MNARNLNCPRCGERLDLEMEADAGLCVDCMADEAMRPSEVAYSPRYLTREECERLLPMPAGATA